MRKVIIRADASKEIGFGHFTRSLALAEYLKKDFDCRFCTFNSLDLAPSKYQLNEISKICKYLPIEAKDYNEYDATFLSLLHGDEIVVLDNYYFSTQFQQKIKDKGCVLVCTDGMNNRDFVADAVIAAGYVKRCDFSLRPDAIFINGLNHTFLRAPFLKSVHSKRKGATMRNIVIGVGGADPYGLTNKLLRLLTALDSKIHISVIAGDTVEIDTNIINNIKIYRRLSAEKIVRLFSESDLGIFSASTICIEALACKLPVAAGWYVDNQEDFYKIGVKEGLFLPLGNLLDNEEVINNYLKEVFRKEEFQKVKKIDFAQGRKDIIELFKIL